MFAGQRTSWIETKKGNTLKKRIEIVVEFDEVLILKTSLLHSSCSICASVLVTPTQASTIAGVNVRTINQWVESNLVHFVETPNGLLFVCLESLQTAPRRWSHLNLELEK
jgi:hypothetical protein